MAISASDNITGEVRTNGGFLPKAATVAEVDAATYGTNKLGTNFVIINGQTWEGNVGGSPVLGNIFTNNVAVSASGSISGLVAASAAPVSPAPAKGELANINLNLSLPVDKVVDEVYGPLVGRSPLRANVGPSSVSNSGTIKLNALNLTKSEAIAALDKALASNGVTVVPIGDKFLKVVTGPGEPSRGGIRSATPVPIPQPEIQTRDNAFSTFSLNVSDVSFRLAATTLQNGSLPDRAAIRSEEFINAFDYRDSEPAPGAPIGFAWERAGYPFAHNRDLLRFSVKTSSFGRTAGRPLNVVLMLDKSGSMERADRVAIVRELLRVLAAQLHPEDRLSVVVFARTAQLWADSVAGDKVAALADSLSGITPEGGTNLEEAMKLAYETLLRHYMIDGENRVVVLTDGAANLGNVDPDALKKRAETNRAQGIALDCFGVGWEDLNDNLLEVLARAGGGRYGFINTPEEAATEFAGKLTGALRVAASDVKVQVEFNPARVISWRQIGYAKDQLKKEQFRDNTVKAAQLGAAEAGNGLYTVELNPAGDGPICTVHVRYRDPGTQNYHEHAWDVPYTGPSAPLDQASPAMRLAATASAFSEWLAGSPYAAEVTTDRLQGYLRGVPEFFGADPRPKLLQTMIQEARSISGR